MNYKKFIAGILSVSLISSAFICENNIIFSDIKNITYAETITDDSGVCGENASYIFDSASATLTISGTGAIYTEDSEPWYDYRENVQHVIIEEGITDTGFFTFYGMTSLESVILPDSLEYIGGFAFAYNENLKSITIPENVKSIGAYAFLLCNSLKTINIPANVSEIAEYAFSFCSGTENFYVDENNQYYADMNGILTDKNSTNIINYPPARTDTVYTIPENITQIGTSAFGNCINLEEIQTHNGITNIENSAFLQCHSLKSFEIPESISTITDNMFTGCSSLTSITIPENIEVIEYAAFADCPNLLSITFLGDAPLMDNMSLSENAVLYCYYSKNGWNDVIVSSELNWSNLENFSDEIRLNSQSINMNKNGTFQLEASINPTIATEFEFTSSNENIATVSSNGLITSHNAGETVIIVSCDNGNYTAECKVSVTENTSSSKIINTAGTVGNNVPYIGYSRYGHVINSYMNENSDGTLTRVEYIYPDIIVEKYSDTYELIDSKIIESELSIFGGFYSGSEYNFFVFGQSNPEYDDNYEILRVVKYSKDWERISSCSVYGANTLTPFDAGSLRMTEMSGQLYIHTCHTMYPSANDGLNHQANMTYMIDESTMTVKSSHYNVSNIASTGYSSHSFDQFITNDGKNIYRCDLGDAYPRAVALVKSSAQSVTDVDYTYALKIPGVTGANSTGVSIGGLEVSSENCLIIGSTVDVSNSETYSASGQRNIFLSVTSKTLTSNNVKYLTEYTENDDVYVLNSKIVKISDSLFLLMWQEYDNSTDQSKTILMTVDGNGNVISNKTVCDYIISDCQPFIDSSEYVVWYSADNSSPVVYRINPYNLEESVSLKGDVNQDGEVTSLDALEVLQMVSGLITTNISYDIDNSGQITSYDALCILNIIVGI